MERGVITEIPLYVLRMFSSPSPPNTRLIGVTSHTNYQLAPPPSPPPKGRGVITEIPLWVRGPSPFPSPKGRGVITEIPL